MTDTPTYRSCILNDGKYAIGQALVQQKKLKPYAFKVGDAYNFTPTDDGTAVSGNLVFTGDSTLISGKVLSKDMFTFATTVPESAGNFNVGNIILYVQSTDGIVFPFIWVASKVPYPKISQGDGIGNRFVFDFVEKIINANDVLAITVTPSSFASLAGYSSETDLPLPENALFQQFYVSNPKYSTHPFVGARRAIDNSYWGLPLFSRVGDPFFGILDSGRTAEPKRYTAKLCWGGRLNMPNDYLPKIEGGSKLTDNPQHFIGGEPLSDKPGYSS